MSGLVGYQIHKYTSIPLPPPGQVQHPGRPEKSLGTQATEELHCPSPVAQQVGLEVEKEIEPHSSAYSAVSHEEDHTGVWARQGEERVLAREGEE